MQTFKSKLGGELGLGMSVKQTRDSFKESMDLINKCAAHSMTGYAITVWDANGHAIVRTHYSVHSGVEPIEAPAVVADLVTQSNHMAMLEASQHAKI